MAGDRVRKTAGAHHWTDADRDELRRLILAGRTVREVAAHFGIATVGIYKQLVRIGVPAPGKARRAPAADHPRRGQGPPPATGPDPQPATAEEASVGAPPLGRLTLDERAKAARLIRLTCGHLRSRGPLMALVFGRDLEDWVCAQIEAGMSPDLWAAYADAVRRAETETGQALHAEIARLKDELTRDRARAEAAALEAAKLIESQDAELAALRAAAAANDFALVKRVATEGAPVGPPDELARAIGAVAMRAWWEDRGVDPAELRDLLHVRDERAV